jgi:sulfonate transport system permease protein
VSGLRSARRVAGMPLGLATVVVTFALLVAWELAARAGLAERGVLAPPSAVVAEFVTRPDLYARNAAATMGIAVRGWLLGNLAAIVAGVIFVQLRVAERLFLRLALTLHCLPLVAVMPLLQLTFEPDMAKVILAALAVFFTTLVGTMLGLRSADGGPLTVVRAWGGGPAAMLRYVRGPSSLPAVITGLQIGAAAATLGAIFGEFIGSSTGLGVLLVNGLQMLSQPQVYAVAVVATLMAAVPYVALGAARRVLVPWAANLTTVENGNPPARGSLGRRILIAGSWTAASVAVIIAAWWLYLIVFDVSGFVGKTPLDVFAYLTSAPDAALHRAELATALAETLLHAGVGYVAGLLLGVGVAIAFALFPLAEIVFTPLAVALRSVPIIALIPVLIIAFGRELGGVVAITAIVTFFPTLANTRTGLDRVPGDALLLMRSYDSSLLSTLWRLQLPATLPAIFASARIAAPTAVLAATLAEWLATGDGLGYYIVVSRVYSDYTGLWAGAAVLTAVSLIFYSLVSATERAVLRRFAPSQLS